jgi:hypothetical protein
MKVKNLIFAMNVNLPWQNVLEKEAWKREGID